MTAANTIWNSMSNQGGQLGSASSLTNLSSEVHPSVTRTRSASELIETTSVSGHLRSKQKVKVRHSVADSSDYYNNRRPQSISLSAQIPVFSTLQSASSVSALGTISENEAIHGSSPNTQTDNDSAIFAEPPDTPLFHYKSSLTELAIPLRGPFHQQHTKLSQTSSNQLSQMAGAGSCHLNAVSSNSYLDSPTTTASPIHTSEPITQQFVPLYLNPHTGQMYSQNHNYFRPISSPTEFISGPPKPDRRTEDQPESQSSSYIKFSQVLAILFFVCGNVLVLAACSLPALFCAHKVHQLNLQKKYREARKHSEYVICFNTLGIILHVVLMLAAIVTAVVVSVILP